jgi:hypothetical protein
MKQLLIFKEKESTGKTKIFEVYSNHSNDHLGIIHWRQGWRCYVISYDNNYIDMSLSCNKELNNFMEKLEQERKSEQSITQSGGSMTEKGGTGK